MIEIKNFEGCIKEKKVKRVPINKIRAKSLVKSSEEAIQTAKLLLLKETSLKTIFRELYEGFRECCDAIGYLKGYKFFDHISITYFLQDILKQKVLAMKFDRFRKLRNGINYYGRDVDVSTVKEALKEIPKITNFLKKQYF